MKNHILTTTGALFAFAAAALAGPLNTHGIPANAQGVLHVDLEAGATSPVVQTYCQGIEESIIRQLASREEYENLKKETGFDPARDISDITIGVPFDLIMPFLTPSSDPTVLSSMVIIVRGTFSPEKILAYAANKKAKTVVEGKHTFVHMPGRFLLGLIDKKTILLLNSKDSKIIKVALATIEGNAKSYAAPVELTAHGKQLGTPVLLGYLNKKALPPSDTADIPYPRPENLYLALSDDGSNTRFRATAEFSSASNSTMALSVISGLFDAFRAAPAADKKLVEGLKFSASEKNLAFNLDCPTPNAVGFVKALAIDAQRGSYCSQCFPTPE